MVAPMARIAFHLAEKGKLKTDVENQSVLDVDMLTSKLNSIED